MVNVYITRLKALVDSATDKDAVKNSFGAKLYNTGAQSLRPTPPSSKDEEIEKLIADIEADEDEDMPGKVEQAMKTMGGKKRRTRKLKRKTRKTRKYSRRR